MIPESPLDPGLRAAAQPGFTFPDTHAHLDMDEFDPDREDVLRRAAAAGVERILVPLDALSERSLRIGRDMASGRPSILLAAGVHPHLAKDWGPARIKVLEGLAREKDIVAVGEIGLDYHYDLSPRPDQRRVFADQLALADSLSLPVIIHSRLAAGDVLAAVDAAKFGRGGILHCFTEDAAFAAAMIDRGFWISFSGILTFPKAGDLRTVAAGIPLERLLIETDAPYLVPVPYRGSVKRNEPAFAAATLRLLAGLRGLDPAELAAAVRLGFARVTGRPEPSAAPPHPVGSPPGRVL